MASDLDPLELHLLEQLAPLEAGEPSGDRSELEAVWRAQVASRHCDFAARYLQSTGRSFYTIGSAGHESNACVALALRPTDPALLHYRSGAFYLARAAQAGHDGVPDILHGVTAARDEPIAGGRHKVFGHAELAVIPQTSTIASHLPRAFGVAFAIERAKKLGVECPWPADSVVVCSFGDASLNHATAQAGLNSAAHTVHQGLPLPLLFVCEDNGLGISVPSPPGWVELALRSRTQLRYASADGTDPEGVLATAHELVDWIRAHRRPAILHLRTVRFLEPRGRRRRVRLPHAAADPRRLGPRPAARAPDAGSQRRPAGAASGSSATTPTPASAIRAAADEAARVPQLDSAAEIVEPLAPRSPLAPRALAGRGERRAGDARAGDQRRALRRARARPRRVLVFGEDVAVKGGVYGVTRGLQKRFGAGARVRHAARRDVDPRARARARR